MSEVLEKEEEEMGTGTGVGIEEYELSRIGVSLPSNLLNKFDEIIKGRGYTSRSEGIRDAIRAYIMEYEEMERETGEKLGTITYIYDTKKKGLRSKLEKIESGFRNTIKTSDSVHVNNGNYFTVVVIEDNVKRIKELAEGIMSQNGVKHVTLTTTYGGI